MAVTLELENTKADADFRLLARDVNKLIKKVNAILNMTMILESKQRGVGMLELRGNDAFLRCFMPSVGFGPSIKVSVSVVANKNPAQTGDSVYFVATIVPQIVVVINATGTVQFYIDGAVFGAPIALVNGSATSAATTALTEGTHTIQASYSGDDNFFPGTGQMTEVIKNPTTLALSASSNPANVGELVTFTATLSGTDIAAATGTVQFQIDGANFGAAVPVNNGSATSGQWSVTAGSHTITAIYSGDANFFASSATITLAVVNSFTPWWGDWHGGDTVDIYGTNFPSTCSVRFGGINAASVTFINSGHIQAVTPNFGGAPAAGEDDVNLDVSAVTPFDPVHAVTIGTFNVEAPPSQIFIGGQGSGGYLGQLPSGQTTTFHNCITSYGGNSFGWTGFADVWLTPPGGSDVYQGQIFISDGTFDIGIAASGSPASNWQLKMRVVEIMETLVVFDWLFDVN